MAESKIPAIGLVILNVVQLNSFLAIIVAVDPYGLISNLIGLDEENPIL
jgi:hypothetical protein